MNPDSRAIRTVSASQREHHVGGGVGAEGAVRKFGGRTEFEPGSKRPL